MKKLLSILLVLAMVLSFASCGAKEPVEARVYVINGPTGIGAVNMMESAKQGLTEGKYAFTVITNPTDAVAKISNNEADIAAIATNLASNLYNKTEGKVTVLAVNTLGVLNVLVNAGTEINSAADLKGKTIYTTGKDNNPEYVINYLAAKSGIDIEKDVTINYVAEGTALVPVWETNPNAVIIAPQPVASSILAKYQGSKIAVDLTDVWEQVGDGSALMQGCVIVRNDFLKENPETVELFLKEYEASIEKCTTDLEGTAALCESYGIVAKAALAKKAIPNCNICFITGSEMKTKLSGYLSVLYAANPKSIGGKLPADDFYYEK